MTLIELLVSLLIASFTIGSLVTGYVLTSQRTEFTTASAAAQRAVQDRIEQARAARWDLYSVPPVNELPGLAGTQTLALGMPQTGASNLTATLRTVVTAVSTAPPLQLVRVECVWSYLGRGPFTNAALAYRGPDS